MLASHSKSWCIQVLFPKKSLSPIGPMQIRFLLEHEALYFCSVWNYLVCLFIYLWILLKFNLWKSFPNVLICSQDFLSEQNRQQAIYYLFNPMFLSLWLERKGAHEKGSWSRGTKVLCFLYFYADSQFVSASQSLGETYKPESIYPCTSKSFNPHGCGNVFFI